MKSAVMWTTIITFFIWKVSSSRGNLVFAVMIRDCWFLADKRPTISIDQYYGESNPYCSRL